MQVSQRVTGLKESATLAVAARAAALRKQGVDLVAFGTGEPDFGTPAPIAEAAIASLRAGHTKYAPTPGTQEARAAIARKLQEENGIACGPEHITITAGAKHAMYMALQALVNSGDEVVIPTPAWVSYMPLVELAGGTVVEVPGALEQGFKITPEALERALTPRTVGVILNSPSNPCGFAYREDELRALSAVVARHPRAVLISDEIYEKLVYPEVEPGLRAWSPASDPRLAGRTITINGFSKAFAMTGWRMGYLCATGGDFIQQVVKLQGQMTNGIPTFFMEAAVEALSPASRPAIEAMRRQFAARAQLVDRLLRGIPRLRTVAPTGAFYAFPSIEPCIGLRSPKGARIEGAQSFAEALLAEAHVALVPGEDFGACARNNIRITFACDEATIEKGLGRLAEFVAGLAP